MSTDEFWDGEGFELSRLRAEVFEPLLAGRDARYAAWDWDARRPGGTRVVEPRGIVVVEGVCALHRMFRDDYDVRVWVEAPYETRLDRGVARDGEAARATWVETWMPSEDRYVERTTRSRAPTSSSTAGRRRASRGNRPANEGGCAQRLLRRYSDARQPVHRHRRRRVVLRARRLRHRGDRGRPAQARCQPGAVRGFIAVNGDPQKGIANIGDTFTSARPAVGARFNCAGAAPQARRVNTGVYEVRFPGNAAQVPLASSGAAETTVVAVGGGVFRVNLWVPGRQDAIDTPFAVTIV